MNDPKTISITVTVLPRSSKNEIISEDSDHLKIKLTASPVKGEANAELIKLLAKKYQVSKSRVEIVQGLTSKNKKINIYLP